MLTPRPPFVPGTEPVPLAVADRLTDLAYWVRGQRPPVHHLVSALIRVIVELVIP